MNPLEARYQEILQDHKQVKLDQYPLAIPLSDRNISFQYGPDSQHHLVQVPRERLMTFSSVLNGILISSHNPRGLALPLKYPQTFQTHVVPMLKEKSKELDTCPTNSEICQLVQMAEYLGIEALKTETRKWMISKIKTPENPCLSDHPDFSPENLSKYELVNVLLLGQVNPFACLKIILSWLQHAPSSDCREMKVWFEQKLQLESFTQLLQVAPVNELRSFQRKRESVINAFFTASEIMMVRTHFLPTPLQRCKYCKYSIHSSDVGKKCRSEYGVYRQHKFYS